MIVPLDRLAMHRSALLKTDLKLGFAFASAVKKFDTNQGSAKRALAEAEEAYGEAMLLYSLLKESGCVPSEEISKFSAPIKSLHEKIEEVKGVITTSEIATLAGNPNVSVLQ